MDPTQTAFVPGRLIGDNVLCHLEEVEYLQQTGQPGCMGILGFSKAYDCLSRPWVLDCMSNMGFGEALANGSATCLRSPQLQLLSMAGSHPAFLSNQRYNKVAHYHPFCMSWQPNLWPVTSGTKPSKASSSQSPCQMMSQRLSATNMLMTPPCMCFSPQMLKRLLTAG